MSRRLSQHDEFAPEAIVPIEGGGSLRTDTHDEHPEGASYLRVCDRDGNEIAYWSYTEWEEAPEEVIGAVVGALLTTITEASTPRYLRFGAWPTNELSGNWLDGLKEAGVSVYETNAEGLPIYPVPVELMSDAPVSRAQEVRQDLDRRLRSKEPMYYVTGDVVGRGVDGEPLLRNVRMLGVVTRFIESGVDRP